MANDSFEMKTAVDISNVEEPVSGAITLSQLPKVTTLAATDLIEIDRNGTGAAVTYATLVDAMTASLGLTGLTDVLQKIIG
ncbi:hypothetical protein [Alistipes finegoldii]|uniref:hypothetical protein n=1 Tax=Alistipes finegoldii TaxID=214856 RepID=UPI0026DBC453|nr:hypothetical protein [Alistipes finegoldii]